MMFPVVFTKHFRVFLLLQGFPAPHGDAAGEDALSWAPVESAYDGSGGSGLLDLTEEVEALLGFLHQRCSVDGPAH